MRSPNQTNLTETSVFRCGLLATLSTTVLPGLLLRARYQGVSPSSDEATFSIDLASSLNLQGGISPGDRRSNYFRTQGGLSIP
ncbi:hypothetical protein [Nostoc sp.]|uniref:hypothetical protein n=1 Tax=Nostoc sp. TaxID=1180 RepID=UPI002FF83C8D